MKIAIIILNYNSSSDCRKCIGFLKKQEGIEMEIVVVDNCSPKEGESSAIRLLCEESECTFIPAKENRGYNAGNNIGLRYAAEQGYKYALIANPDMEFPQTEYLKKMVDAMETDEDIVVCGSDIVGVNGVHQNPLKRDGDWRSSFGWIRDCIDRDQLSERLKDDFSVSHYCDKVGGCCLFVRMNFIKNIGFFDENVFLYCEEAILSRQVENKKKKIFYLADATAVHRHIKSEKGNPIPRFKAWMESRLYFANNYGDKSRFGKFISLFSIKLYAFVFLSWHKIKH
jgi:hypothetical protein